MATVDKRIEALGLALPAPIHAPTGLVLPFEFVRIAGTRAFVSGHLPANSHGSIAAPRGEPWPN